MLPPNTLPSSLDTPVTSRSQSRPSDESPVNSLKTASFAASATVSASVARPKGARNSVASPTLPLNRALTSRPIETAPISRHPSDDSSSLFSNFSPASDGIHYLANVQKFEDVETYATVERGFVVTSVDAVNAGGQSNNYCAGATTGTGVTVRALGPSQVPPDSAAQPRWHKHQTLAPARR